MDNQTLAKEIQIVSDEIQFLFSMLKNLLQWTPSI